MTLRACSFCVAVAALLFAGCATAPRVNEIAVYSDAQLRAFNPEQLATEYFERRTDAEVIARGVSHGFARTTISPAARAQLETLLREHGLTDAELAAAAGGRIFIGMSRLALIASRGGHHRINRTVTADGVSEQWVLGDFGPYVYLDNGRVTSWQDGG